MSYTWQQSPVQMAEQNAKMEESTLPLKKSFFKLSPPKRSPPPKNRERTTLEKHPQRAYSMFRAGVWLARLSFGGRGLVKTHNQSTPDGN